jgi:predicted transcriptional regulator
VKLSGPAHSVSKGWRLKMYEMYRSRTEIIAQILRITNGRQVNKTWLMYGTFLSYKQLKNYISILIENGLLEYQSGEAKYTTTEKGIRFLKLYEKMKEMTEEM